MKENNEIIRKFLSEFEGKYKEKLDVELRDWNEIKEIVTFFIDGHKESNVLDFIDISNWDSIERFSFDDQNRTLELVWHDFMNSTDQFEISIFGAHLLKCEVKIDSIIITLNKRLPVLILKGFYQDPKEIQRSYNKGCSDMKTFVCHPFSTEIVKVVKKKLHHIIVPNIHCYTMSIFPNYMGCISPDESKDLLFKRNLKLVSDRIIKTIGELKEVDESDQERLHELGNSARINFENALKILTLKARTHFVNNIKTDFDKDYQKLMLGDLVGVLKNFSFAKKMGLSRSDTVDILNKCSHDAGVFIKKDDVLKALLFILAAINLNNTYEPSDVKR